MGWTNNYSRLIHWMKVCSMETDTNRYAIVFEHIVAFDRLSRSQPQDLFLVHVRLFRCREFNERNDKIALIVLISPLASGITHPFLADTWCEKGFIWSCSECCPYSASPSRHSDCAFHPVSATTESAIKLAHVRKINKAFCNRMILAIPHTPYQKRTRVAGCITLTSDEIYWDIYRAHFWIFISIIG